MGTVTAITDFSVSVKMMKGTVQTVAFTIEGCSKLF